MTSTSTTTEKWRHDGEHSGVIADPNCINGKINGVDSNVDAGVDINDDASTMGNAGA